MDWLVNYIDNRTDKPVYGALITLPFGEYPTESNIQDAHLVINYEPVQNQPSFMRVTIDGPSPYAEAQGEVYYDGTVEVQSPEFANSRGSAAARLKAQIDATFTSPSVYLNEKSATLSVSVDSDRRHKLYDMVEEVERLVKAEFPRLKQVNSLNNSIGGSRMALTKIRKRLNSSMSPQAMRVFNKCMQRVIDAIDEAADEMADYPEAAYFAFLDELEGSVQATLDSLREEPFE